MISEILNKIKSIIEVEAVPGGRLSVLKKVYTGDYQMLPAGSYPAATVTLSGIRAQNDSGKTSVDLDLTIGIFSLKTEKDASLLELSELFWKRDSNCGIVPVLSGNQAVSAGGDLFRLEMGKVRILQGADSAGRYLWAMEIPLTLKAWI